MDQQFKMKLLNSIKTILKEETDKSIFVRRRIHYIEDYLDYTIRVANQSRNTCRFQNRNNYVDYIVEETVSRLWQGWFSEIDDMSEEWADILEEIENHIFHSDMMGKIINNYNRECS